MMAIPRPKAEVAFKVRMPNPGSLFSCRGPKTPAVSWRIENQIVNSSYNKNSPDISGRGLLDYPQHWMHYL
jgi:hypothetical protein